MKGSSTFNVLYCNNTEIAIFVLAEKATKTLETSILIYLVMIINNDFYCLIQKALVASLPKTYCQF